MVINEDKVRGALFGQGIGDALGLPAEFNSKSALLERMKVWDDEWPNKYRGVRRGSVEGWKAGDWTDDTEQAVAILVAYLGSVDEGRDPADSVELTKVAEKFMQWAIDDGRGMGHLTGQILDNAMFCLMPQVVAEDMWKASGRRSAPNGAVMRTAPMGVLRPLDAAWTAREAAEVAKVTHFDPRCVASAVAVSVTISKLVTGSTIPEAIEAGIAAGREHHPEVEKFARMSLAELDLDEGMEKGRGAPIGYTYKCMGSGFAALREYWRQADEVPGFAFHDGVAQDLFKRTLTQIVMEGGDADTNGAVAGAMLGAFVGYSGIPDWMKDDLLGKNQMEGLYQRLLALR